MNYLQRKLSWWAVGALVISLLLSLALVVNNVKNTQEVRRELQLRASTQLVESAIVKSFIKPITVAKAMSEDANLKENLRQAGKNPQNVEKAMQKYLAGLRDGMGYKIMFAVCDESGAYFTYDGITSYINKKGDRNSAWYLDFMKSGKKYDLDVDIEESTDWALSVFVNQLVVDNNQKVLGVCGTGIEMTQLQSLLQMYERIHQVKIDVLDDKGLIQIDTDVTKIEKDYIKLPKLKDISDGEYYYEKTDTGDRVITYMEELDMYLVVANKQSLLTNMWCDLQAPLLCAGVGLLLALGLMVYAGRLGEKQ